LKILPESFATDPDRLARFQREAEVLASLNHPNIAAIHGLEESNGTRALVMELVEGETLADQISRGPIPIDEALPIAKQIAEALEAAHERGIIHRDLKPANVKLRPDGTVKVLDFGLAKALEPASAAGADATASPTITSPALMTGVGALLGTAAYMSPEQARGKAVDKRSDIWAFGCVLYETLTGRRAFGGDELTDTLAFIITRDPDWTALPPETPAVVLKLLKRCLEKERRRRLADAADARLEIEEAVTLQANHDPSLALASTWDAERRVLADAAVADVRRELTRSARRRMAALVVGALVMAAFAGAAGWLFVRPAPSPVTRLMITTGGASTLTVSGQERDLAITPDGLRLVYHGPNQLLVRALDQLEPAAITGLGAPRSIFVSPDGQWIGYFDGTNGLRKVSIAGGPPVVLRAGEGNGARGATWAQDGTIVYATSSRVIGLKRNW
jgi:serine/threonine-protein kinase